MLLNRVCLMVQVHAKRCLQSTVAVASCKVSTMNSSGPVGYALTIGSVGVAGSINPHPQVILEWVVK